MIMTTRFERHAGGQPHAATESDRGPDINRIMAMAAMIVLHLVAVMLLLRPPAFEPVEVPREIIVLPIPRPIEPAPPPVVPVERTPPESMPRPTRPDPVPVVLPTSEPVDHPTPPLDIGESVDVADGPDTPDNGPPDLSPMTGARLAYASAPAPRYPVKAVREGRSGIVLLQVTVDENGRPVEVTVSRSSGHRDLDQAAVRQVIRNWRFQPATRDGHPIRAIGLVPVEFKL